MSHIMPKGTPRWLIPTVLVALVLVALAVALGLSSGSEWRTGKVTTKLVTLHEDSDIWGLAFSPDGKYLASDSPNSPTVHIWDWRKQRIVRSLDKGPGASDMLAATPILYSPDGHLLAACHKTAKRHVVVNVWNADTGKVMQDIVASDCRAIAFTPDGQYLLRIDYSVAPGFDDLVVYSTRTWQQVWSLFTAPFAPSTLALSPDGKQVALGGDRYGTSLTTQSQIEVIDLASHTVVRTISPVFPAVAAYTGPLRALAWSPDGIHLAAEAGQPSRVGGDAVRIFNMHTGRIVASEPGPFGSKGYRIRYTPDSKYLIESAIGHPIVGHTIVGHYIEIWDAAHRHLLEKISGEAESMAVSRDSKYLAMGGNKKIIVWELK